MENFVELKFLEKITPDDHRTKVEKASFLIQCILMFEPAGQDTLISLVDGSKYISKQSYVTVKSLIKDAKKKL